MESLTQLAALLKARNTIDVEIARLVGRPALMGHVGEYIAAAIFNISLESSANHVGSDGHFLTGPLAGRTVNIKWYGQQEGVLDIATTQSPQFYLVLTGAASRATTSLHSTRPWLISSVFIFNSDELHRDLAERTIKIGVATSVRSAIWKQAEKYPAQLLTVTEEQRRLLALFRGDVD